MSQVFMDRLTEEMLRDLDATSDEELLAELAEDGVDVPAVAVCQEVIDKEKKA